jgi:hypothetical protein
MSSVVYLLKVTIVIYSVVLHVVSKSAHILIVLGYMNDECNILRYTFANVSFLPSRYALIDVIDIMS